MPSQAAIDKIFEAIKLTQKANLDIRNSEPTPEIIADYWVQETRLADLVEWLNTNPTEKPDKDKQSLIHSLMISLRVKTIQKDTYPVIMNIWNELDKADWI